MNPPNFSCDPLGSPKPSRQGQGGGPKTPFGKEASSKNSTTHGLSARFVKNLPDSFQNDVNEQMAIYVAQEQPQTDDDRALCSLAALAYVQHREAISEVRIHLAVRSFRAQTSWEVDRVAETARLGARLAHRPEIVAAELGQTFYGALWLLERWKYLDACLDATGKWSSEDVSLAYDLIGRDPMMRSHDPDGLDSGDLDFRRQFVKGRIAHLESLVNGPYRNLDQVLQGMAVEKQHYLDEAVFRRLTRLEHRALRIHQDALRELQRRRVARELPSDAADGTLIASVAPIGMPPCPASEPSPPEAIDRDEAQSPAQPYRRPEPRPTPKPVDRPQLAPEERRQRADAARQAQEADREARRRDKAQAKAERKAVKAARVRARHR